MMLIRLLLIFMAIVFDCAAYRVTRITAARGLKARLPNMDYSRSLRSVRTGAEGEEQTLVNKMEERDVGANGKCRELPFVFSEVLHSY